MSVLHTLLAIDGRAETLEYLSGMGLTLPEGFRSRHPDLDQVQAALARLRGWRLGEPDHPGARRFACDVYREGLAVTTLVFAWRGALGASLLTGTRGDPGLPLLRELARALGPLVVLLNAEEPLLVEAPSA